MSFDDWYEGFYDWIEAEWDAEPDYDTLMEIGDEIATDEVNNNVWLEPGERACENSG